MCALQKHVVGLRLFRGVFGVIISTLLQRHLMNPLLVNQQNKYLGKQQSLKAVIVEFKNWHEKF